MFGFVIGTVCLIGLVKMIRHGHHGCGGYGGGCGGGHWGRWGHRHHGHWGHGGWGGHEGPAGGGWGEAFVLRGLFERLQTTPGQERVIRDALGQVRETGREAFDELHKAREEVAKVMRSANFDETSLGEAIARQDAAMDKVRKVLIDALAKVHQSLEPEQRERLADMIARGHGLFGRGGPRGPWNV